MHKNCDDYTTDILNTTTDNHKINIELDHNFVKKNSKLLHRKTCNSIYIKWYVDESRKENAPTTIWMVS